MTSAYPFNENSHVSVMLDEVLKQLSPQDGETYVDGTFGAGGYSRAILNAANCRVFAIDRDPDVENFAKKLTEEFPARFSLILGNFSDMADLLVANGVEKVDGVVLDLGVSSMQLSTPERGFSFMADGPLDMRMEGEGKSAEYFVNNLEEKEIADIIYKYGDEKKSRAIARLIVKAREVKPISGTLELAEIVRKAVHRYKDKIDPATRTFQAIRIWVNDELEAIAESLLAAEKILAPGGRLVVVSFHSLEDSIIKDFLNERSGKAETYSRHMPVPQNKKSDPSFSLLTKKAVKPTDAEVEKNPKARSAKLRAALKINLHSQTNQNKKESI